VFRGPAPHGDISTLSARTSEPSRCPPRKMSTFDQFLPLAVTYSVAQPEFVDHCDPVHLMNTFRMAEVFVLIVAMFWVFDLTRAYFASRHKD
jgi:hypothetical protein